MNIYVGNLSFDETEQSMETAFAAHGEVESARIISDRESGRSRGFGFVEMPDQNAACDQSVSSLRYLVVCCGTHEGCWCGWQGSIHPMQSCWQPVKGLWP